MSPGSNFQSLSGSSRRSRNRFFCSARLTSRKILMTRVPGAPGRSRTPQCRPADRPRSRRRPAVRAAGAAWRGSRDAPWRPAPPRNTSVEDADHPPRREGAAGPPEEIMREFLRPGRLEGGHGNTLRVHAGHHVLDGAVLPGRIHAWMTTSTDQVPGRKDAPAARPGAAPRSPAGPPRPTWRSPGRGQAARRQAGNPSPFTTR